MTKTGLKDYASLNSMTKHTKNSMCKVRKIPCYIIIIMVLIYHKIFPDDTELAWSEHVALRTQPSASKQINYRPSSLFKQGNNILQHNLKFLWQDFKTLLHLILYQSWSLSFSKVNCCINITFFLIFPHLRNGETMY